MIEKTGNMFHAPADAVVISTNGFVKANGEAVMGKGCAKQAADAIPNLPAILGYMLTNMGNRVHVLMRPAQPYLLSFPVKQNAQLYNNPEQVVSHMRDQFKIGQMVPGWALVADMWIIKRSATQLKQLADLYGWQTVVMPRVGCGAGELDWEAVKAVIEPILDDRFHVYTY